MTNDTNRAGRDDTTRPDDWTGEQWAGDEPARQGGDLPTDTEETRAATDRWNKTEWVGDQGEGSPAPIDPDEMPEGEQSISGFRHGSGEQHWAGGQADVTGDREADRS